MFVYVLDTVEEFSILSDIENLELMQGESYSIADHFYHAGEAPIIYSYTVAVGDTVGFINPSGLTLSNEGVLEVSGPLPLRKYYITVTATVDDRSLTNTFILEVLEDPEEKKVEFDAPSYHFDLLENQDGSSKFIIVGQVLADSSESNYAVTYSFSNGSDTFGDYSIGDYGIVFLPWFGC